MGAGNLIYMSYRLRMSCGAFWVLTCDRGLSGRRRASLTPKNLYLNSQSLGTEPLNPFSNLQMIGMLSVLVDAFYDSIHTT